MVNIPQCSEICCAAGAKSVGREVSLDHPTFPKKFIIYGQQTRRFSEQYHVRCKKCELKDPGSGVL